MKGDADETGEVKKGGKDKWRKKGENEEQSRGKMRGRERRRRERQPS